MGLLADGISNSNSIESALKSTLASRLAVPRLALEAAGGVGSHAAAEGQRPIVVNDRSGNPTQTAHETARLLAWGA